MLSIALLLGWIDLHIIGWSSECDGSTCDISKENNTWLQGHTKVKNLNAGNKAQEDNNLFLGFSQCR